MKNEQKKEMPGILQDILNLIPEGSANPITVSTIRKLTGLSSVLIRSAISQLILTYGQKIATSQSGYYIITNDEERDATVRNLRSRAFKILARAKAIESMPSADQLEMTGM